MSSAATASGTGRAAPLVARGAALVAALLLAACATKPPPPPVRTARVAPAARAPAPSPAPASPPVVSAAAPAATAPPERDGPDPMPPPDLERVPDAEPALEPIRSGGPNKPYEVAGQAYVPITKDEPFVERGLASWYGRKFHGRRTASGEVYNMYAMTAAHKTLPIPSYARVRNPANGAQIVVRVNDRGPFVRDRIVDLSYTAALKLGVRGVAPVEVERITFDDIRTGAWRREPATAVAAAVPPPAVPATPAAAAPSPDTAAATVPAAIAPTVDLVSTEPPATGTASPPVQRAYTAPARGFWVQLGAFKERGGAEDFHRRVSNDHDWLAPMLALFVDLPLFRLQAGPYPSRDEARGAAEQIRSALKLVPVVLERR